MLIRGIKKQNSVKLFLPSLALTERNQPLPKIKLQPLINHFKSVCVSTQKSAKNIKKLQFQLLIGLENLQIFLKNQIGSQFGTLINQLSKAISKFFSLIQLQQNFQYKDITLTIQSQKNQIHSVPNIIPSLLGGAIIIDQCQKKQFYHLNDVKQYSQIGVNTQIQKFLYSNEQNQIYISQLQALLNNKKIIATASSRDVNLDDEIVKLKEQFQKKMQDLQKMKKIEKNMLTRKLVQTYDISAAEEINKKRSQALQHLIQQIHIFYNSRINLLQTKISKKKAFSRLSIYTMRSLKISEQSGEQKKKIVRKRKQVNTKKNDQQMLNTLKSQKQKLQFKLSLVQQKLKQKIIDFQSLLQKYRDVKSINQSLQKQIRIIRTQTKLVSNETLRQPKFAFINLFSITLTLNITFTYSSLAESKLKNLYKSNCQSTQQKKECKSLRQDHLLSLSIIPHKLYRTQKKNRQIGVDCQQKLCNQILVGQQASDQQLYNQQQLLDICEIKNVQSVFELNNLQNKALMRQKKILKLNSYSYSSKAISHTQEKTQNPPIKKPINQTSVGLLQKIKMQKKQNQNLNYQLNQLRIALNISLKQKQRLQQIIKYYDNRYFSNPNPSPQVRQEVRQPKPKSPIQEKKKQKLKIKIPVKDKLEILSNTKTIKEGELEQQIQKVSLKDKKTQTENLTIKAKLSKLFDNQFTSTIYVHSINQTTLLQQHPLDQIQVHFSKSFKNPTLEFEVQTLSKKLALQKTEQQSVTGNTEFSVRQSIKNYENESTVGPMELQQIGRKVYYNSSAHRDSLTSNSLITNTQCQVGQTQTQNQLLIDYLKKIIQSQCKLVQENSDTLFKYYRLAFSTLIQNLQHSFSPARPYLEIKSLSKQNRLGSQKQVNQIVNLIGQLQLITDKQNDYLQSQQKQMMAKMFILFKEDKLQSRQIRQVKKTLGYIKGNKLQTFIKRFKEVRNQHRNVCGTEICQHLVRFYKISGVSQPSNRKLLNVSKQMI